MNQEFYKLDAASGYMISDPDLRHQTEYFVWDPHGWYEYNLALKQGVEFFPRAEIYRGPPGSRNFEDPKDKRKKIAIINYTHLDPNAVAVNQHNSDNNLSNKIKELHLEWADLVITFTTEAMTDWWPVIYGQISKILHTDRIKCVFAAHGFYTQPITDRFFCDQLTWCSQTVYGNYFQEIDHNTYPNRPFMFDALLGIAKPGRLNLLYKILDSGWTDRLLVSLQPNPFVSAASFENLEPSAYDRYGIIENYQSPALFDLEEEVVKQFKNSTRLKSRLERYSVNLVEAPNQQHIPGSTISASTVVPWNIYKNSWYSIVSETIDRGIKMPFVTEKTGKCLFAKRIFVMFNSSGILDRLKRLGFQTFHGKYIDESYDNEPNDQKRFDMAWQQVEQLFNKYNPVEVYQHYQEVLEHNHQHLKNLMRSQLDDLKQFVHTPFSNI